MTTEAGDDIWARVEITQALVDAMEASFPSTIGSSGAVTDLAYVNYRFGQGSVTAFLKGRLLAQETREQSRQDAEVVE